MCIAFRAASIGIEAAAVVVAFGAVVCAGAAGCECVLAPDVGGGECGEEEGEPEGDECQRGLSICFEVECPLLPSIIWKFEIAWCMQGRWRRARLNRGGASSR